jgi:hypothetical protein
MRVGSDSCRPPPNSRRIFWPILAIPPHGTIPPKKFAPSQLISYPRPDPSSLGQRESGSSFFPPGCAAKFFGSPPHLPFANGFGQVSLCVSSVRAARPRRGVIPPPPSPHSPRPPIPPSAAGEGRVKRKRLFFSLACVSRGRRIDLFRLWSGEWKATPPPPLPPFGPSPS